MASSHHTKESKQCLQWSLQLFCPDPPVTFPVHPNGFLLRIPATLPPTAPGVVFGGRSMRSWVQDRQNFLGVNSPWEQQSVMKFRSWYINGPAFHHSGGTTLEQVLFCFPEFARDCRQLRVHSLMHPVRATFLYLSYAPTTSQVFSGITFQIN